MRFLKNAYEQNLAQCIGAPQSADFSHSWSQIHYAVLNTFQIFTMDQGSVVVLYRSTESRAIISFRYIRLNLNYSGLFPAVTTPDPGSIRKVIVATEWILDQ